MSDGGSTLVRNPFFYLWCTLLTALILLTVLPDNFLLHDLVTGFDSNRWAHFIAYACVIAIPFVLLRRRTLVPISMLPAFFAIGLEFLPIYVPGEMPHARSIAADFFGVGAGILLGLNIRLMRTSAKNLNPSGPQAT